MAVVGKIFTGFGVAAKRCMKKRSPVTEVITNRLTAGAKTKVSTSISKVKTSFFTKAEMLDMKPSEFKNIMELRKDIPEAVREGILTPAKLNLYDKVLQLETVRKMEVSAKEDFLKKLFGQKNLRTNDACAQLEIIPDLIKKGYNLQMLAELPITENNKSLVEAILKRKDLPEKYAQSKAKILGDTLNRYGSTYLDKCKQNTFSDLLKYVDKKNFKYIDECLELTGNFSNLPYWKKDTSKILRDIFPEFIPMPKWGRSNIPEILDRLHRNGHNYQSVKAIYGDKKGSIVTQRLLEYKNFDKFKNIGIEDFDKLSIIDKKDFIRAYISALTPKELLYRNQHNLTTGFEELQNSMKIYKTLNPETTETLVESYYNTLRSLMNKLPESERKAISSTINTKHYRRQYRLNNPIPSLVDEFKNALKTEKHTVNGKTIKYAEMGRDVDFGISTHRFPNPESILTIEALEEVDPNMLLCVGTKGGKRGINIDKTGYALIVKPRKSSDWHVQAYCDIDSGNNAMKNIYNFEHIVLPEAGNHAGVIDLVQNEIKKDLNLSQREYTKRLKILKNCRTIGEIGQIDPVMEKTIRKVIKEKSLYEGLMRPESMGITIPENIPLEKVSPDIIDYCIRRDIPLVRITENASIKKYPNQINFNLVV